MNTIKDSAKKREPRNLGVTVLAGAMAVLFGGFATYLLSGSQEQLVYGVVIGLLALVCLVVAVYGRKSLFKLFIELFGWFG